MHITVSYVQLFTAERKTEITHFIVGKKTMQYITVCNVIGGANT